MIEHSKMWHSIAKHSTVLLVAVQFVLVFLLTRLSNYIHPAFNRLKEKPEGFT